MLKLLKMFDVQPIYEERPAYFNDEYDEAVLSKDCNDPTLDNSIESVYKQGWRFKDKILRYEQVVINKYKENND
jgi:molecular chaperone GrpE (heat shock protein)